MRIDPETCRDPELLASEVRRLQAVIAANALTAAERTAIRRLTEDYEQDGEPASEGVVATLRGLLERLK